MLVVLGSPAATNVCSYPSIPLLVTYSLFFSTDYMPPEIPEILGPGPLPLVSPSSFKLHHLQPSVLRPPYQLSLPFKPPTILPRSCYPTTYSPAHLPHSPSSPSSQPLSPRQRHATKSWQQLSPRTPVKFHQQLGSSTHVLGSLTVILTKARGVSDCVYIVSRYGRQHFLNFLYRSDCNTGSNCHWTCCQAKGHSNPKEGCC